MFRKKKKKKTGCQAAEIELTEPNTCDRTKQCPIVLYTTIEVDNRTGRGGGAFGGRRAKGVEPFP